MTLDIITCFIAVVAMGLCCWWIVRWFFKLGTASRKNDQLSPEDLLVLEETTRRLMDDLRNVTGECVARIELACLQAEKRLAEQESPEALLAPIIADIESVSIEPDTEKPAGVSVSSFAKSTGLTLGEVELMRGLMELEKSKKS